MNTFIVISLALVAAVTSGMRIRDPLRVGGLSGGMGYDGRCELLDPQSAMMCLDFFPSRFDKCSPEMHLQGCGCRSKICCPTYIAGECVAQCIPIGGRAGLLSTGIHGAGLPRY